MRPNARYANGMAVPTGMRINVPGMNTSGVGPGTDGYRGSYRYGGYNGGAGTGRPGSTNAADYYSRRGSSLDRYSNNASTNNGASWAGAGFLDGARREGGPVRRGGRYLIGEDGPEIVQFPQEGYVTPNPRSRRAPSFRNADEYYAFRDQTVGNPLDRGARKWGAPTVRDVGPTAMTGADWAGDDIDGGWFAPSAIDRLEGAAEPYDGEMREGRDGRMWRYDASLGQGVPVNVYGGSNLHAPSPPVELMDPQERFNDLRMRLDALRAEAGRGFQDKRRFDEAQFIQPKAVDSQMTNNSVGGRTLVGRYGSGLTTTVPIDKSFTVDREDGTQGRYANLDDAEREGRAVAASRRVRGTRAESARRLGY